MKPSHMNPRWLGWRMGDASRSHLRPGHPHAGGAPTSLRPCRGAGKQAARPVPPFAVILCPTRLRLQPRARLVHFARGVSVRGCAPRCGAGTNARPLKSRAGAPGQHGARPAWDVVSERAKVNARNA